MMLQYLIRNIISIARDIFKNITPTLISSFGIIFLIAFLIISISIDRSLVSFLEKKIFGTLDINQVKITPKRTTDFIKFSSNKNKITGKQVKKIKKKAGLKNIQKVIRLNYPTSIKAGMMGRYLRSDMLVSGVDKSFFKNTGLDWKKFRVSEDVPVVIPEYAINLYNNFAATNSLPELGEKALDILSMEIIIGKSSFEKSVKQIHRYQAHVFGFTPHITAAGIIVPSEFITNYCRKNVPWKERGNCYSCIMIFAEVEERDQIPEITKELEELGLNVVSQADIAEKTENAVSFVSIILSAVIGVILILTIIAIFNSFLAVTYNRSDKLSIQRLLGATKMRIIIIFVTEAALVGAVYGTIGYFLGFYFLNFITGYIAEFVPVLYGLDLSLDNHSLILLAVPVSSMVSAVSALIPSIFASNINLFNVFKK